MVIADGGELPSGTLEAELTQMGDNIMREANEKKKQLDKALKSGMFDQYSLDHLGDGDILEATNGKTVTGSISLKRKAEGVQKDSSMKVKKDLKKHRKNFNRQ
eukprot:GHVU01106694.1.p5 GENE.GHVU01106694.1~~GHVU01106694.1.p5  ORF type:complete len:103 (-),score=26.82 GHVU01106694.1:622-930(-)